MSAGVEAESDQFEVGHHPEDGWRLMSDCLSAAAGQLRTVTVPALGNLLDVREKHLSEDVKTCLAARTGRPVSSSVVPMPQWAMRGAVDVVVPEQHDPKHPRHVMELKWCQRQQDKVYEAIWDLFKVALLSRLDSVKTAHLVTGAPLDLWGTAFCRDIFEGGKFEPEDLCSRVFPMSPTGRLAWENLLGGGNDRFPYSVPAVIETRAGDRFPVIHEGLSWELRVVSVHPSTEDVEFHAGWPHGRRPAGPRPAETVPSTDVSPLEGEPHVWRLGTIFDEAIGLARTLHRTQSRKGTSIPYLAHLMAVSALVLEDGGDEDQAIAAVLHDAVEDQGGQRTLEQIRRTFGERVAEIVEACSDTTVEPKPPWRERKERYLEHLRTTTRHDVLRVSLADKLHNARAIVYDLREHGDELWARFNTGRAEDQLWYYDELAKAYAEQFPGRLADELRRTVDELHRLARPAPA